MVIKGETDMLETFNVLRIDEPDFGCEGRPDGMAVKDNVLLKSNYTGEEMTVRERMPGCMSWISMKEIRYF